MELLDRRYQSVVEQAFDGSSEVDTAGSCVVDAYIGVAVHSEIASSDGVVDTRRSKLIAVFGAAVVAVGFDADYIAQQPCIIAKRPNRTCFELLGYHNTRERCVLRRAGGKFSTP